MYMCFAPVAAAVLWIYGKRLILDLVVESEYTLQKQSVGLQTGIESQ